MGFAREAAAYLHDQSKYPSAAFAMPTIEQGNLDSLLALTVQSAQRSFGPDS